MELGTIKQDIMARPTQSVFHSKIRWDPGRHSKTLRSDRHTRLDLIRSGGRNNFKDPDGDPPAIAITGTNLHGGTLYYSTDNGSSWTDVGPVGVNSARVLYSDNKTRLAYRPVGNFTGTIDDLISFKAWDRRGGIANGAGSIATTPSLISTTKYEMCSGRGSISADDTTAL